MRAQGLRVALDDFGTGFASLTHLLTFPVDMIKIDKSFVGRLSPDDSSSAIVKGILDIAAAMGIGVIAEGIETEAQAGHLRALGCMTGQGYLFSPAVDQETLTRMLTAPEDQFRNRASARWAFQAAFASILMSSTGRPE